MAAMPERPFEEVFRPSESPRIVCIGGQHTIAEFRKIQAAAFRNRVKAYPTDRVHTIGSMAHLARSWRVGDTLA